MNDKEPFATELLREVKNQSKRWFIAFLIMLILFFVTNIAWLYVWNLPAEESDTMITQESDHNSNNYCTHNGD